MSRREQLRRCNGRGGHFCELTHALFHRQNSLLIKYRSFNYQKAQARSKVDRVYWLLRRCGGDEGEELWVGSLLATALDLSLKFLFNIWLCTIFVWFFSFVCSYAYCFVAALSANKDVYTIQRRFIRAVENGNGLTLPMAWVGSVGTGKVGVGSYF